MILGQWLKMSEEDILILTEAGLLHDIGKLLIPNEIINVFCEISTEIIGEKIDREKIKIIDNKIKMESQNQTQNEKTKFNFKNTYIDQDGKYLQNKEFEPKYSLYFYREGKDED